MAPPTAPAVLQFLQVMEQAMGMTAEPITMPMNCRGWQQQQRKKQRLWDVGQLRVCAGCVEAPEEAIALFQT
jgi:hypothetical protein